MSKLVLLDLLEIVLPVWNFEKHVLLVTNFEHFLQSCIFVKLVYVVGLLSFRNTCASHLLLRIVLPCVLVIDHLHILLNQESFTVSCIVRLLQKTLLRLLHASKGSSDAL